MRGGGTNMSEDDGAGASGSGAVENRSGCTGS